MTLPDTFRVPEARFWECKDEHKGTRQALMEEEMKLKEELEELWKECDCRHESNVVSIRNAINDIDSIKALWADKLRPENYPDAQVESKGQFQDVLYELRATIIVTLHDLKAKCLGQLILELKSRKRKHNSNESGGDCWKQVKISRKNLPKASKEKLRAWFKEHYIKPFPVENEKKMLAAECNITLEQVTNWFINERSRNKDYKLLQRWRQKSTAPSEEELQKFSSKTSVPLSKLHQWFYHSSSRGVKR